MSRWMSLRALLWICLFATASKAWAELPTPIGLERDVKFWEKIFSQYTPDQCVFHDKDDLSIIYVVKKLPGSTAKAQLRNGRRYLAAIRAGIKYLAAGGTPRNLLERRIVAVTPVDSRTPTYYRGAADNIRCQRGVDLNPSFLRSRQHLAMVKRILTQHGLPSDLAYLPHLESGYHVTARSRVGARGLWQLMPATARLMGLRVTRTADQRVNPYKATLAAANILKDLYSSTRSWPLAITAYNYGPNGMNRAIRQWGNDYMTVRQRHRTRIFGFASRNYYPSFLAVRNVAGGGHNGEVDSSEPIALDSSARGTRRL